MLPSASGVPEHPCSFCGAPRPARLILFVNERHDTFVCNVCVEVLAEKLQEVYILAVTQPPTSAVN